MVTDIKVLLVEDDQDLRDSVMEWLELNGMQVTAVGNAAEFYQTLSKTPFQVAVIDVGLPDQEGYVLAEYARANTAMAIIILTARNGIDDKLKGYQAGADLYLVKPVDCRELAAVIRSMAARTQTSPAEVTERSGRWVISATQWELRCDSELPITLSQKELLFLELLAANPGLAVPKRSIQNRLYQRDDYHSSRSLDSLVRRLRAKISARLGIDLPVRTVHSVGYCFAGDITHDELVSG